MDGISFTVCFEDPYWVGLIECNSDGHICIGKTIFGAEPSNAEILEFAKRGLSSVPLHRVCEGDLPSRSRRTVKSTKNGDRTGRSLEIYKSALCSAKTELKAAYRRHVRMDAEERFRKNQLKRKQKKRGR